MPRSAAARSCSTMTVSAPRVCSVAGDSVPQNGQTSACFAGFQCASRAARRAVELLRARTPTGRSAAARRRPERSHVRAGYFEEVGERRARDAPLRADLLALEIAGLEARDDVGFGDAERLRRVRRAERSGMPAAGGRGGRRRRGVRLRRDAARLIHHLLRDATCRRPSRRRRRRRPRRPSRAPAPSGTSRSRSGCRPPPCSTACRSPLRPPAAPTRSRG